MFLYSGLVNYSIFKGYLFLVVQKLVNIIKKLPTTIIKASPTGSAVSKSIFSIVFVSMQSRDTLTQIFLLGEGKGHNFED
jgi:hypothetical protein